MKFILKPSPIDKPMFKHVKVNQFFVSGGCLCQKVNNQEAFQLTDADGSPYADSCSFDEGDVIDKILPEVDRIEY